MIKWKCFQNTAALKYFPIDVFDNGRSLSCKHIKLLADPSVLTETDVHSVLNKTPFSVVKVITTEWILRCHDSCWQISNTTRSHGLVIPLLILQLLSINTTQTSFIELNLSSAKNNTYLLTDFLCRFSSEEKNINILRLHGRYVFLFCYVCLFFVCLMFFQSLICFCFLPTSFLLSNCEK